MTMGFALTSLMAEMLVSTLILYWAGLLIFRGKTLTTTSKLIGFLIALPSAAISALILAPEASVNAASTMFWPGSLIGATVGLVMILSVGKRKVQNDSAENS